MTKLRERARRLHTVPETGHLFKDLGSGRSNAELAHARGLPLSQVEGVQSFYDQLHRMGEEPCVGTACWVHDGARTHFVPGTHCLGHCYAPHEKPAPAIPRRSAVEEPIVLRHLLGGTHDPFGDYALPDGDTILATLAQSGLRGRGGAAFPTAKKWQTARETRASERVVVANGDEGDPGAYVDRLIMEEAPHALLAGMLACARAISAHLGIVFVRGEYPAAAERVEAAIREAEERGILGEELSVRVVRGAGSYVAGEETALLRAIEGLRAEPYPKPPYPAERGLWGLPTVVQNVETLSVIPWVVTQGRKPNSKAFCISGAVKQPGIVEAELGTTLADLLTQHAEGPCSETPWKMALVGGPMGRLVPLSGFDVPLDYDTLQGMGHGGIVVMDERVSARALFEHLCAFAKSESCGACTPCRAGTTQLAAMREREALERLLDTLEIGSMCGFGQGVPRPIRDLLTHFSAEVLS